MKRLAATGVVAEAPQWCTRSCAAKVEASHGAYWHRRTQGGKPDLRPDRERRDRRTAHSHAAGAIRCGARSEAAGEAPHRGDDRERMGCPLPFAVDRGPVGAEGKATEPPLSDPRTKNAG